MSRRKDLPKSVVIVGGGFSGTVLAVQLLRRDPNLAITILDKGRLPACGVAYGTPHPCHLLNVSAGGMSAFPAEPDHFLNWARKHRDSPVTPGCYLPRALYGQYLGSLLEEALARPNFELIRDEAQSIRSNDNGFVVARRSGPPLATRAVILALGNFPPGNPGIAGAAKTERYFSQAWSSATLDRLSADSSVLLIGTGLTSVDMAIAIHAKGFTGQIHLLSRRGLQPQRHSRYNAWRPLQKDQLAGTVRGLLRQLREEIDAASAAGSDWRAVIDALRPHTQDIWGALPLTERRKFPRHLRAHWEVHRHRIAPEIADIFSGMVAIGQVHLHSGRIISYDESLDSAQLTFRTRSSGTLQTLRVDRVINCTGPETDYRKIKDPLLMSLLAQGLIRQDALGLGLETDIHGALADAEGTMSHLLYAIGPARKSSLWETTAVPELRVQAADLADHLVRTVLRDPPKTTRSETRRPNNLSARNFSARPSREKSRLHKEEIHAH